MSDCKLDFITLDAELLVESLKNSQPHTLSDGFLKLASRFGGPNADLESHLSVLFRAIAATWRDSKISWTLRYAAVGKLLEEVSKNRTYDQFIGILKEFFMFDQRVLRDLRFTDYLNGWLRGHFIQIR